MGKSKVCYIETVDHYKSNGISPLKEVTLKAIQQHDQTLLTRDIAIIYLVMFQ